MKAKKAKKKVTKKAKLVKVAKKAKQTKRAKKPVKDIIQAKHPETGVYVKVDRAAGVALATKKTKFAGFKVARKIDKSWFA